MGRLSSALGLALLLCVQCGCNPTTRVYDYEGSILVKNTASGSSEDPSAIWTISGKLVGQETSSDVYSVQLKDIKTRIFNGAKADLDKSAEKDVPKDAEVIMQPFVVHTGNSKAWEISHQKDEPVWSVNMKRAIISAFYMNKDVEKDGVVQEKTIFGDCDVKYTFLDKGEVHKSINHTSCENTPDYLLTTAPLDPTAGDHIVEQYQTMRVYTFDNNDPKDATKTMKSVSLLTYQTMPRVRSNHQVEQVQEFKLISSSEKYEAIDITKSTERTSLVYSFDDSSSHTSRNQQEVLAEFEDSCAEYKYRIGEIPLKNVHENDNDTISDLFELMKEMEKDTLVKLGHDILHKNDSQAIHVFQSLLPYVGTADSVKYIKELFHTEESSLNDLIAIRILATFPRYVDENSKKLLVHMEDLMDLKWANNQVNYAGILSFASLVESARTDKKMSKVVFKKYVKKYYKLFKASDDHEVKMTYLLGLVNMGNELTSDFMLSIITDHEECRHLRALATYSFKKFLVGSGDEVYDNLWPVVQNSSEHYELRVAALDVLLYSELSEDQFKTIVYGVPEDDATGKHLYHYVYTTLQALQNSTRYYEHSGDLATKLLTIINHPVSEKSWTTGNYRMAYTDTDGNYGASFQTRLVANPITNVVNVAQISCDQFAASFNLGMYTAYVKVDGLADAAFVEFILDGRTDDGDEPIPHLVEMIKKYAFQYKVPEDVHIEVVIFDAGRAVFGIHIGKSTIDNYTENPLFLDLLKLVVDYNSISIPLMSTSYIVSDLGTQIEVSNEIKEASEYELEHFDELLEDLFGAEEIVYNLKYRSVWYYQNILESTNPLLDTEIGSYKYMGEEKRIFFPYSFNISDFHFKWRHTEDSFNAIWDHLIGSYVDKDILHEYCPEATCSDAILIPEGDFVGKNAKKLWEYTLGVKFNVTKTRPSEQLIELNNIEPRRLGNFADILDCHEELFYDNPLAEPILTLWHYQAYSRFLGNDLGRFSIRTSPYYDFPTESILQLDFDSDDIKSDKDPISGTEFDFSVALTTRKVHDAEMVRYVNSTFRFESASKSVGAHVQPHIEKKYSIDIFMTNSKKTTVKACLVREVFYPNRRTDRYSLDAIEPAKATTIVSWGHIKDNSEACPTNASVTFTEVYSASDAHKKNLKDSSNYVECKKESAGFKYVPPTQECVAVHNQISKYDSCELFADLKNAEEHLPKNLRELKSEKYGVKLLKIGRVNDTHFAFTIDPQVFSEFTFHEIGIDSTTIKTYENDDDILSTNPAKVAYDDFDLDVGLSSACYITPSKIRTFTDNVVTNYYENMDSDPVAYVECVNQTRSGMTLQRVSDKSLGFTFWSGNSTLITSVAGDKMKVELNHKEIHETYNEQDDDLKIYFLDHDVLYITDGVVDIFYNTEYITIKAMSVYNGYICGLCNRD